MTDPTPAQLAFLRELQTASTPARALFTRGTRDACRSAGWVERDTMLDKPGSRYWLTDAGRAALEAAENHTALLSQLRGSCARDRITITGPAIHALGDAS